MNIREVIRDTIQDLIDIDRHTIEDAIMDCDIQNLIENAIALQLPAAIEDAVKEEIDDAVAEAISDALA